MDQPHLRVEETPESRRGETLTYAGGNEIKKEGKVTVNWLKVGPASRTMVSVDGPQGNRS